MKLEADQPKNCNADNETSKGSKFEDSEITGSDQVVYLLQQSYIAEDI